MPPAPRGKGKAVKAEWVLCSASGLLTHSEDSAQHAAWLEAGQPGPAPHAHIAGDRLVCPAAPVQVPRATLGLGLPEDVLFASVFVSPAVASACRLGQGAMVELAAGQASLVLRCFSSSGLVGRSGVSCVSQSWPALVAAAPGTSLSPLAAPVRWAAVARVRLATTSSGPDPACPRLWAAARLHLAGLVLRAPATTIPLPYYGATVGLEVTVGEQEGDLAARMEELAISPEKRLLLQPSSVVTSTPVKAAGQLLGGEEPSPGQDLANPSNLYRITLATDIQFESPSPESEPPERPVLLCGLEPEIGRLQEALAPALRRPTAGALPSAGRPVTGVLLTGAPGTGKTSLALALPRLLACRLVSVAGPELYSSYLGETEARLKAKFAEAAACAPCILFIDELDCVAPRREAGASAQERRVGAALLGLLDGLGRAAGGVAVVAATSRLDSVDPALRRPGRLDLEVELGVPGAVGRAAILAGHLAEAGAEVAEEEVVRLARDTHGFVGADLQALVGQAGREAGRAGAATVTLEHLLAARTKVKPSAMREVVVEVPEVSWQDIGGLEELKLKLRQAVEWPVRHPEVFLRMGISAPRGLLMYGPPGCSKTMIAKALANESGLNFLSIKGPELFSKWVGESERAVREVFRRARQVKPSIIFFDEIDAIGGARGGAGAGRVGDRVLAQLLTEMDGVEGLAGVTVVAATNRPDMMDPALLRPGRLDRVVYVPLPDLATRRQVLAVHTRRTPLGPGVDLEAVAQRTEGYSGAEVAAVCNEAALAALEESVESDAVQDRHFQVALAALKPRITAELFDVYERFQADNTSKKV